MPSNIYTREFDCSKNKTVNVQSTSSESCTTKYIFVSGGVISGLGKGITTSFIGAILKGFGYRVTAIKIDPYLNLDAGTFSPYEHGEVFVLDDGAEVDLDLGNYERMLDVCLSAANNITTGKIYDFIIKKERQGQYLGKTVQIVPHVTDAIADWIDRVSRISVDNTGLQPHICLVEVGGIVGDIESMPFLEAIRQFQTKTGRENYCHMHLALIPKTVDGEDKTKPAQLSVRQMRSLGLFPDFIFCRCQKDINESIKKKLSAFTDVPVTNIISLPDLSDIYQIVPKLYQQNIVSLLNQRLNLQNTRVFSTIHDWNKFSEKNLNSNVIVEVAIVGKYVSMKDAYHSVSSAINHSALHHDRKAVINWIESHNLCQSYKIKNEKEYSEAWEKLKRSSAVIIPGGFDKRGIDGKIEACKYARENKVPILGICLGLQIMLIEFARNVLGLHDANSTEFDTETKNPVVTEMPEFNPEQKGGTMRLGLRKTLIKCIDSHSARLYDTSDYILERHRHRFEFNIIYKSLFEEHGILFVGEDDSGARMEIVELPQKIHPFYAGVQYHPEFLSRPFYPSPLFRGLIASTLAPDKAI